MQFASRFRGRALRLLQSVEGNGFEAWRLICRECESRAIPRRLVMLQELLRPHFGFAAEMKSDFLNLERDVSLIAVSLRHLLKGFRRYMLMSAHLYGEDYGRLRDMVMSFVDGEQAGGLDDAAVPMDVDAVLQTGKGGGKGDRPRTAMKDDICRLCQKRGHWAKDCRSKGRGKGRGKGKSKDRDVEMRPADRIQSPQSAVPCKRNCATKREDAVGGRRMMAEVVERDTAVVSKFLGVKDQSCDAGSPAPGGANPAASARGQSLAQALGCGYREPVPCVPARVRAASWPRCAWSWSPPSDRDMCIDSTFLAHDGFASAARSL